MNMSAPAHVELKPTDPGAAQFLQNLSEQQLRHLAFAVPSRSQPERFSRFLETPRRTPVPKRFTFDALNAESRKAKKENAKEEEKKDVGLSGRDSANSVSSIDLIKEVEKVKVVVEVVGAVDWRFYATGGCLCLLNLVSAWDAISLAIALPAIASTLKITALRSFWLVISFLVAGTVFSPLFATLSIIFGRKPLLLASLTFLTCGSFIAAISANFWGILIGRTVQGVGSGGITVLSNLIVSDLVSAVDRRKWSGIIGAIWAFGAITGLVIGDGLANPTMYRWVFWINLPFCLIAFLIIPFFAQLKPASPGPCTPKLKNVDWVGFFLLVGSLVSVLLGLTWGGTKYPWSSFHIILPLQFGFIGLMVFGIWSWFSPFAPIITLHGLDRTSIITQGLNLALGVVVYGALYLLPLYFNIAKPSHSLISTGAHLLPWSFPLVLFSFTTYYLLSKATRLVRPAIWTSWFMVTLGVALMVLFKGKSTAVVWAVAILSGSGIGMLYASLHIASQYVSDPEPKSDGISIITPTKEIEPAKIGTNTAFAQLLGATLGVSISFSIFQNQFLLNLTNHSSFSALAHLYVMDSIALVTRVPAGADGSSAAQMAEEYIKSLRTVWIVLAVFAGTALVASMGMNERNRREEVVVGIMLDGGYVV